MATDQLIIGGFVLDGFKTPEEVGAGGKQAMAVHKLPGGSRHVQTLGPDEADITLSGLMFSDDAHSTCVAIDAMRAAGGQVPLIFGGQYRSVIVEDFQYRIHRFPNWCTWSITMLVVSNPMLGGLGSVVSTVESLVSADIATALTF